MLEYLTRESFAVTLTDYSQLADVMSSLHRENGVLWQVKRRVDAFVWNDERELFFNSIRAALDGAGVGSSGSH